MDKLEPPPAAGSHLPTRVEITWIDDDERIEESLPGYAYLNRDENTTEFRLAVTLDLSPYKPRREGEEPRWAIFYGEGTGYACWKDLDQIAALRAAGRAWGRELLTPFLRKLVD